MRLLCVIPSYFPAFKFGGPIVFVHGLNKLLVQKGIEVVVYTTTIGLEGKVQPNTEVIIDGVRVIYFDFIKLFEFVGPTGWQFSPLLAQALKNNLPSFDIVYISAVWNYPVAATTHYCRKYNKPYIISPCGVLYPYTFKKKSLKKWLYYYLIAKRDLNNASAIHYTTQDEFEKCHKFLDLKSRSFVMQSGIDFAEFVNLPPRSTIRDLYPELQNKKVILFLSRLDEKKGLDLLAQAYSMLAHKRKDVHLLIAGEGEKIFKEKIKKKFIHEGILDRVTFAGMLTGKEKLAAFTGSDVFVLPSYSENLGLVVVEAMISGLPVIVTEEVGIAKIIKEKDAGIVVKINVDDISKAIEKILNSSPILINEYKQKEKILAEKIFSLHDIVNLFIERCEQLLGWRLKNTPIIKNFLCVMPSYFPALQYGGPIVSVHNLNKALVQKGIEVVVYTTTIGLEGKVQPNTEVIIDGVRVIYFDFIKLFEFVGPTGWQFSPLLTQALKNNLPSFDIVYISAVWNYPVAATTHYCRKYGKPYIIAPRGVLYPYAFKKKSLKKWLYYYLIAKRDLNNASAIHYTTQDEFEKCHKFLDLTSKFFVVPNGINIAEAELFPPHRTIHDVYPEIQNKKVILFLSRLDEKKGLDLLAKAYGAILRERQDVHLLVVGEGEESFKKKIKKWFDNAGVSAQNVTFAGMLTGEEKSAAFTGSDVFVLPSYSENFGVVIIEAMMHGIPVIVTEEVGIAPIIKEYQAGIVIKLNSETLQKAIEQLIDNQELKNMVVDRSKALVIKEFAIETVADIFLSKCNQLL